MFCLFDMRRKKETYSLSITYVYLVWKPFHFVYLLCSVRMVLFGNRTPKCLIALRIEVLAGEGKKYKNKS